MLSAISCADWSRSCHWAQGTCQKKHRINITFNEQPRPNQHEEEVLECQMKQRWSSFPPDSPHAGGPSASGWLCGAWLLLSSLMCDELSQKRGKERDWLGVIRQPLNLSENIKWGREGEIIYSMWQGMLWAERVFLCSVPWFSWMGFALSWSPEVGMSNRNQQNLPKQVLINPFTKNPFWPVRFHKSFVYKEHV